MVGHLHFIDQLVGPFIEPSLASFEYSSLVKLVASWQTGWTAGWLRATVTIAPNSVNLKVAVTKQHQLFHSLQCNLVSDSKIVVAIAVTVAYVTGTYLNSTFQFHSSKSFFASLFRLTLLLFCCLLYSFQHNCVVLYTFNLEARKDQTLTSTHQFVGLVSSTA